MKRKNILSLLCALTLASSSFANNSSLRVSVYETAKDTTTRLALINTLKWSKDVEIKERFPAVFLDTTRTYQSLIGFGGAFTDAAAETYAKLSREKRKEFIDAYFSLDKGIGYTFGRTTIHSTDFSSAPYTYVKDYDTKLSSFDISVDKRYRIPMIKDALARAGKITMFVSPWSPPAWMKTNNNMLKGGELKKEYEATWANYYVKFIQAYEKAGIPIWGLTVQNEPASVQRWESCIYSAERERDFIKEHLGPSLHRAGYGDKKLIAWDHNRGLMFYRASTIYNDPETSKYVWGLGIHWYSGKHFENVALTKQTYPDKHIIFTEGCVEAYSPKRMEEWRLGERYALNIIHDLNGGVCAWSDWNLLLDDKGGPNHVGNFCLAPIHADLKTGDLVYTNSYYYIGHLSKFIRPGAKRVLCSKNDDDLSTTAFKNTDGSVVVVVLNATTKAKTFDIWLNGEAVHTALKPSSIYTFVMK